MEEEPADDDFESEDDEDEDDEDDEGFASEDDFVSDEPFDVAGLLLDEEPRLSFR
ncbi:TATA-binding protein-associated factor Taf7 [Streptomyces stelliscabiei]|uniref:TATA-binding protein-associated factor Taf7 n=1 Tax=Streptomyces stelliscabiei TaxID=146820 RepID=A0A8I0P6A7_9ACTN|nr:TATA-binding protein-associated factor Taf7 [Streptomyces stelliscabiei]